MNSHFPGIFIGIFLVLPLSLCAQNVAINTTGATGDSSALLDVNATDKGILIPRVNLTSTLDITTILSPAISLLVYNASTLGTIPDNVVPGFYYWDGEKWVPMVIGQSEAFPFAEFYALMPGDNAATVAAGVGVQFPQNGPSNGGIVRANASQFVLPEIGTYQVDWQVSVSEAGQLVLGLDSGIGMEELAETVVGRATGTSQIVGSRLITTTAINSILSVLNPTGNTPALTITPNGGGTHPVSASLVIIRKQ